MISNEKARELMYAWHAGAGSPMYQAASAGLCASFSALADDCAGIETGDKLALLRWIEAQQAAKAPQVTYRGQSFRALPWLPEHLKCTP